MNWWTRFIVEMILMNFELFQKFQTFFQRKFPRKKWPFFHQGQHRKQWEVIISERWWWTGWKWILWNAGHPVHFNNPLHYAGRALDRSLVGWLTALPSGIKRDDHQEILALSAAFYLFLPLLCVAALLFFAADAPAIDRHWFDTVTWRFHVRVPGRFFHPTLRLMHLIIFVSYNDKT
jgi:hypothetical protein